jgi:hypothetical protein
MKMSNAIPETGSNGLDQLRRLGEFIENMTDGKQRCVSDLEGGVYIRNGDSAVTGLFMRAIPDFETGLRRLSFQGYLSQMGTMTDAAGIHETAKEVGRLADLLTELERNPVAVAEEEIARWSTEISGAQIDRTLAEPAENSPSLDSQMMGMV